MKTVCRIAIAFALSLVVCGRTADAEDELGKTLNLTSSSGSLPIWTKPPAEAVTDLSHVAHDAHPSIFIVGKPDEGFGTAFLISKKHRLLATNAHVADIMHKGAGDMLAIENGTSNVFKVENAYYHPGVRRNAAGITIRSSDPSKGDVDPRSPDVAILQLADGADLPDELPLATRDEVYDLFAKPVGMIGFPGHDTISWPGLGQKAEATFREGVVSRVTDFVNDVNGPPDRLQYIQHSMASWFGFSGSPIFLSNGHVVALNNSGRTENRNGLSTSLAYGVRVDCLWELLKYNHLLDQVNVPAEALAVDVDRFSQPDPAEKLLQKVRNLLAEAEAGIRQARYTAAVEKCNSAVELLPNYSEIYEIRGRAYNKYSASNFKPGEPRGQYYDRLSFDDNKRALELNPSDLWSYLDLAVSTLNLINGKNPKSSYEYVPEIVEIANKIISQPGIPQSTKAYAYGVRASGLGFSGSALDDIRREQALDPYDSGVYWRLSMYWDSKDNAAESARAEATYRKLREADGKAAEAWLMATSTDDNKRDGRRAYQLAVEACAATDYNCPGHLNSLAAAYAECGDFEQALNYQQKALKIAWEEMRDKYAKRLKFYQNRKPWRED